MLGFDKGGVAPVIFLHGSSGVEVFGRWGIGLGDGRWGGCFLGWG